MIKILQPKNKVMKDINNKKSIILKNTLNEKLKGIPKIEGLGFQLLNNQEFKNILEQVKNINKLNKFKSIKTLKPFIETINNYKLNIPKIDTQNYDKETILFIPSKNYEAEKVDLLKEQVSLLKKVTKSENNKTIYKDLKIKNIIIKNNKGLLHFYNSDNKFIFYLTNLESIIFKIIKDATKNGGIKIENIKIVTNQQSIGAVKQIIKQIQMKIKKHKLKDYIKINSRLGFYKMYIEENK